MKAHRFILILIIFSFIISPLISAIIVNPPAIPRDFTSAGTYYHSSGNLAYFAVDHVMTFTQVVVDSTYVEFNNTKFNISSPNRINISLDYLDSDMTAASGTTLVSFYAQTTAGTARFNISSFSVGASYEVFKNNVSMANATANATGFIYFTNSVWTTAYFEITLIVKSSPTTHLDYNNSFVMVNATGHGSGIRMPYEQHVFFANGRYWVFYGSYGSSTTTGRRIAYESSIDGITWGNETTILTGYNPYASFDTVVSGNTVHLVYAYTINAYGTNPRYINGTLNTNGTITWNGTWHVIDSTRNTLSDPSLIMDSSGYLWFSAIDTDMHTYVYRSSTTNAWIGNYSVTPYSMNSSLKYTASIMVALDNGTVYCMFARSYTSSTYPKYIWGKLWNGTGWGSQEVAMNGNWNGYNLTTDTEFFGKFSATSIGNVVHIVFSGSTNETTNKYHLFHIYRDVNGVWSTPENLANITTTGATYCKTSPTISKTSEGLTVLYAVSDDVIADSLAKLYLIRYINSTGTWTSPVLIRNNKDMFYTDNYRTYALNVAKVEVNHKVPFVIRTRYGNENYTNFSYLTFYTYPAVITNNAIGVEETNATLMGTLTDDGGEACSIGFQYGLNTSYGTNVDSGSTGSYTFNLSNGDNWNVTFPESIWLYNSSIAANDTCANFCQVGGIYANVDWIFDSSPIAKFWHKGFGGSLTNINYGEDYYFSMLGADTVNFNYDTLTVALPYDFSNNLNLLSPGTLYHYRTYATNSNGGTSYGIDREFLTKPNNPDTASFSISSNTRSLDLTWTKATGANTTLIVRKQGAYPLTKTDGTIVYNGTGSSYTNTGLTPGVGYGYRAWSYTSYGTTWQFSDLNASACEMTKPEGATNANATFIGASTIRINWTKGTGANNTILVKKTTGYPTSWTDGTIVYNGTGLFKDVTMDIASYYKVWSYAAWIINPHLYEISANSTNISLPGGGLLINCFDENDHHNLTFSVKVSNQSGSKVYENTSCTNTLAINASLCPQGTNIQVIVSATGYHQRIYTLDIYTGIIYLLNAYLPPETAPGNGTEDCELRPYIDSMTITNHAVDAVVTLTYTLEDMISVEIYNASLYGTYGGWIFVASDKYAFTTTSVTINETVLDVNTTMARVSYYYNFCEGGVESALYYLRVVETIETGYTQVDQAVENVLMQIKRYINSTGTFVDVSSIFTDANGYVNIYLVPNAHYKIFLNKSGYDDVIGADYIPNPPNVYGQTVEKVFRITKITSETNATHPYYESFYIHFTGIRITTTLYVNYTDDLTNTTNTTVFIYEIGSDGLETLLFTISNVSEDTLRLVIPAMNPNLTYKAIICYTHTNFGVKYRTVTINGDRPIDSMAATDKPGYKLNLLAVLIGYNPFGWLNFLMFMFLVAGMYYMDERYAGILMMFMGGIFLMLNIVFGFTSTFFTVAGGALPVFFLVIGFLYEWVRSKKRRMS